MEHRTEHEQVWVVEAAGQVAAAVTLTFAGQPYSEIAAHGELELPRRTATTTVTTARTASEAYMTMALPRDWQSSGYSDDPT